MRLVRISWICAILVGMSVLSACGGNEKESEAGPAQSESQKPDSENASNQLPDDGFEEAMSQLTGIEKHFVQGDLKRYRSLLKYQGNDDYKLAEDFLPVLDAPTVFVEIKELDAKNGFIKYESPGIDCKEEMTYWKKSDGSHLIGKTQVCCTMFCEGEISFQLYDSKSDVYQTLALNTIIPDYDLLKADLTEQQENGGIDYQYILPQKGLNLEYCVGDGCVELIWTDGTFKLAE